MTERHDHRVYFVNEPNMTDEEAEALVETLLDLQDQWMGRRSPHRPPGRPDG